MMLEKSRCQVVDSHQFRLDGRIAARAFLRSVLCPSKCTSAPHYPRDYLILHDSGAAIHLGLSNPEGATRVQNCKVTMWSRMQPLPSLFQPPSRYLIPPSPTISLMLAVLERYPDRVSNDICLFFPGGIHCRIHYFPQPFSFSLLSNFGSKQ